nr:6-carboxytetrahydropterin synthase [Candidatus Sigynarchaeota archaeon]
MGYKIIVDGIQHKFSSAHFIAGHDKCGRIHGHNFHVRVEIEGPLDDRCFVLDFMDVKKAITIEIEKLDHRLLVPGASKVINVIDAGENLDIAFSKKRDSIPKEDTIVLPVPAIT